MGFLTPFFYGIVPEFVGVTSISASNAHTSFNSLTAWNNVFWIFLLLHISNALIKLMNGDKKVLMGWRSGRKTLGRQYHTTLNSACIFMI